jgi:GNAT superfamily N-acetyltransferase
MTEPTAPDGMPIVIRPALVSQLHSIPWRCWGEDGELLRNLFVAQETIGMAAWEGERCVGVLHTFRVELPTSADSLPDQRLHYVMASGFEGLAWCHACFHVGRTLEFGTQELAPRDAAPTIWDGTDQRYFSRGIGTALLRESIHWARLHGYQAVIGSGAPSGLFNYCVWTGMLPYTTYGRLGFEAVRAPQEGDPLPAWAEGDAPPEVLLEARAALRGGRPPHTLNNRVMILRLPPTGA